VSVPAIDSALKTTSAQQIREHVLARREIALLDVREEALHAEGHPLFAANLPLSRLELEVYDRLPRRSVPIAVFDDGEGLAAIAAGRLRDLGYTDISLLEDGLSGWREAGFEIFRDVNVPSKAFGELVAEKRQTPFLSAEAVNALIDAKADVVIMDARRFDEFQTMSIPSAVSVPGGELVLRARDLAPRASTQIIVNCAGRTRSILGAQSLINAGLPNPVAALRNGTIGWILANQTLEHGASRRFRDASEETKRITAENSRSVADRAGVKRVDLQTVRQWVDELDQTIYRFDVRTPEDYAEGHLAGFRNAPGGQLVQEADVYAPVRGAKIVLADTDGTRANMTASWLAQMGWMVFVLEETTSSQFSERRPARPTLPGLAPLPARALIGTAQLQQWLSQPSDLKTVLLDFAPSSQYRTRHIPTARFAIPSHIETSWNSVPRADRYVLTSPDGLAARFAWPRISALTRAPVFVLEGGTKSWADNGFVTNASDSQYISAPTDRYSRPYEGTSVSPSAMQAYLEWEYGLVEQLRRDGTHGFKVHK
jgi:rhodanese-related sulfurtransferase